jgi:hypothetical protein
VPERDRVPQTTLDRVSPIQPDSVRHSEMMRHKFWLHEQFHDRMQEFLLEQPSCLRKLPLRGAGVTATKLATDFGDRYEQEIPDPAWWQAYDFTSAAEAFQSVPDLVMVIDRGRGKEYRISPDLAADAWADGRKASPEWSSSLRPEIAPAEHEPEPEHDSASSPQSNKRRCIGCDHPLPPSTRGGRCKRCNTSLLPCKDGVACHRSDCWWAHPAQRAIRLNELVNYCKEHRRNWVIWVNAEGPQPIESGAGLADPARYVHSHTLMHRHASWRIASSLHRFWLTPILPWFIQIRPLSIATIQNPR